MTAKEVVQILILVAVLQFGFSVIYRIIWLLTGMPLPFWGQKAIVAVAGVTNLLFIIWCGGKSNEK